MKCLVLTLTALLLASQIPTLGHATSLHPCTPVVPLQPDLISCLDGNILYDITIQTLGSDPDRCPSSRDRVEWYSAEIRVIDQDGTVLQTLQAYNGEFSFVLDKKFSAPKLGLKLKKCTSPLNGGALTFGN